MCQVSLVSPRALFRLSLLCVACFVCHFCFKNCAIAFCMRAFVNCAPEKNISKISKIFPGAHLLQNCATEISVAQYKLSSLVDQPIRMVVLTTATLLLSKALLMSRYTTTVTFLQYMAFKIASVDDDNDISVECHFLFPTLVCSQSLF